MKTMKLFIPMAVVAIIAILSVSIALGDDFKMIDGKEYKNATVTRVEPDGIVVKTKSGISKLYFVELPEEVQQRFNYNPQQASAYSSQQAASYEAYQKQQEEAQQQRDEAAAQNKPVVIQQQPEQHPEQQLGGGQSTGGRTRPGPHPAKTLTWIPIYERHEHHEHHEETHSSSKPRKKTH
jgi:sRNA-binding protein